MAVLIILLQIRCMLGLMASCKAREYDFHTRFIELAAEINEQRPYYVASRIMEVLDASGKSLKGARVLILGIAYKKDVGDTRESPSLKLVQLLREKGANVDYNDPYIPRTHKQREHDLKMVSKNLTAKTLAGYDVVLISTDHSDYDYDWIVKDAKLVVDSRNATKAVRCNRRKIVKA